MAQAFDALAALLTALAFGAMLASLSTAAQRGSGLMVLTLAATALACGTLLLRRQAGQVAPMLPVDLLRRPLFALSVATSMASFAAQSLAFVSLPFFIEGVLQRASVQTGFLIAPWAIVVAAAAPFAGRLSERWPPGLMGGIGLLLLSAGLASLALLTPEASTTAIVLRMALCGLGFGLFQSPNLNALMSSAPPERSGGASAMVAMARLNGQAIGAALVALCFSLAAARGPVWALWLGAALATVAALASAARLWVAKPGAGPSPIESWASRGAHGPAPTPGARCMSDRPPTRRPKSGPGTRKAAAASPTSTGRSPGPRTTRTCRSAATRCSCIRWPRPMA